MNIFLQVAFLSALVSATPPGFPPKGTIIMPASHLLEEIPKGDIITDAGTQQAGWLFDNTGLVLNSLTMR